MDQIELIDKRKPREKHFLQKDGIIRAEIYDTDIHYLKDGKYEEIDNTLVKKNDSLVNVSNDYQVEFKEDYKESLMKMSKDNHFIDFKIRDTKDTKLKSDKRKISKQMKNVTYNDIADDITIEYQTLSNKVKETIVLQNANHSELSFELDTNLKLKDENGEILALDNNTNIVFKIEKPFMVDANGIRNDNVNYSIKECDDKYILDLILDDEWLKESTRFYPVYIDPTITTSNSSLYDTYIFPGDDNASFKSSSDILKAGVCGLYNNDNTKVPHRTLIKFDLPEIGTGSEIINAYLDLIGYPKTDPNASDNTNLISFHRITADWTEAGATWSQMNDKYDTKVEALSESPRSVLNGNSITPSYISGDITNLVKKWYRDTDNNGILIKSVDETYIDENYPAFFSKDNNVTINNPKPIFVLEYRNQNGLEEYMDYKNQPFTFGSTYVNTFNGNMTGIFELGHTIGGTFPANLELCYNTNDVVLSKETFFGVGYKLNVEQTLKEISIDNINYLEYTDEDGTIHYFYNENVLTPNIFIDEDGLNLMIEKNNQFCTMKDTEGNKLIFTNISSIYYITQIIDADENTINITLDTNNKVTKICDRYNSEINITYENNLILITNSDGITKLNYQNNKLVSIEKTEGIMNITYNSENLISCITDVNNLRVEYEYYNKTPYRLFKISRFGLNNEEGKSFTLEYGFNSTTLNDNMQKSETIIFNSNGNVVSRNNLKSRDDINGAYSITQEYGYEFDNYYKNKILSNSIPITHIKNLLLNTSFEDDQMIFSYDNGILMNITSEDSYMGNRSLKLSTNYINKSIEHVIATQKNKYYTFSGYFKNTNLMKISLCYSDINNDEIICEESFEASTEYERHDVTIFYPNDANSDLKIRITLIESGNVFIDNIQLEEGEVANAYNIIENSDFSTGYSEWDIKAFNGNTEISGEQFFELVRINNNQNTALKVKMNPKYPTVFSKEYPIKGKRGELYTLSFWYKNEGVTPCRQYAGNTVTVFFNPEDEPENNDYGHCIISSPNFNPNDETWQYFSYRTRSLENFKSIKITFSQDTEANNFYITNLSFYKEITSGDYDYDANGNIISIKNQSDEEAIYGYDKNNKLISITTPKGKKYKYEYDNIKTNRVLSAISSSGISNEVKYDEMGNPTDTIVSKKFSNELSTGEYRIRNKGTENYLKAELNNILLEKNKCSNTIWKIEKNDDEYKFKYATNPNFFISRDAYSLILSCNNNTSFYVEKNENDSYNIYTFINGEKKYLKVDNLQIILTDFEIGNPSYQFYFEEKNDLFIENNATYTDNGRFIECVNDGNLNKTKYITDTSTGLLLSTEDANHNLIEYTYNNKNQIEKVNVGERQLEYRYNQQNLIQNIIQGNKVYNINYDNFLNISEVKIGNQILLSNEYENHNGNLKKVSYGNNNDILYDYDDFNRIMKIQRNDNTFKYRYDNNGNIAKVLSNEFTKKFSYDVCNRIHKYTNDKFVIKYNYDNDDNIISKTYKSNNIINELSYSYDENDYLTQLTYGSDCFRYQYDILGRIVTKKLNDNNSILYEYKTNGKRTTDLIEKITQHGVEYKYNYDEVNNIKSIYINGNLSNEYFYDNLNELVEEKNYIKNEKIEYEYDDSGNIIKTKITDMQTSNIIKQNLYSYNNEDWEDQLTSFNNDNIGYDTIGNPITINNNIFLNWINGKMLNSYTDTTKNISATYKYNENGIRFNKNVNGTNIEYFLEDNNIVYEKRNNNLIYYLYDLTGLAGIEYNQNRYYFQKNIHDDIIAILNSNDELIAKYDYDSWGNILSIKDSMGNEITDSNHIAIINPFRYRSYYFDNESGLYYLNSRYYNPKWGRFISPDNMIGTNEDILAYNLYTYVSNNPIMYRDYTGYGLGSIVKKIVNKITSLFTKTSKNKSPKSVSKNVSKSVTVSQVKSTNGGSGNKNKLPTQSEPNSVLESPNGTKRYYGPDGRATKDLDSGHPQHHPELENPHQHDWTWDDDGKPKRGKARNPDAEKIVLETGEIILVGYVAYRIVRLIPSLLPGLWWTLPINIFSY